MSEHNLMIYFDTRTLSKTFRSSKNFIEELSFNKKAVKSSADLPV